jgi:endogenous inhibitor of DNA gyrase (YacG/DUF329 family)
MCKLGQPDKGNDTGINVQIVPCETCGRNFERATGKRGRPQVFCCEVCQRLAGLLPWLEGILSSEEFNPTNEKRKALRKRLWAAGNLMTIEQPSTKKTKHHA